MRQRVAHVLEDGRVEGVFNVVLVRVQVAHQILQREPAVPPPVLGGNRLALFGGHVQHATLAEHRRHLLEINVAFLAFALFEQVLEHLRLAVLVVHADKAWVLEGSGTGSSLVEHFLGLLIVRLD